MIFRCKICLLAGSYWCLVGNFREWSTITIKNHPSNPQQPIHSLRLAPVRAPRAPWDQLPEMRRLQLPPPWRYRHDRERHPESSPGSYRLPGPPAISAETDYIYIFIYNVANTYIYILLYKLSISIYEVYYRTSSSSSISLLFDVTLSAQFHQLLDPCLLQNHLDLPLR